MSTDFRLESSSLVLRPLTLGDTPRVLEMSQEDCARRWLSSQVYQDERHAATAIAHMIGQFDLEASPTTNAFVFGAEPVFRIAFCAAVKGLDFGSAPDVMRVLANRW